MPRPRNPDMEGTRVIVSAAARAHIDERAKTNRLHDVSDDEIREALLLDLPPVVFKSHRKIDGQYIFWGETVGARGILVIAVIFENHGMDEIHVVTSFEPDDGFDYFLGC